MLDCGNHTRDELEEEEKTVLDSAFAAVFLDLIDHALHYCCVVARVNAKLVAGKLGMGLECHCFARIICHDVLEHLVLRQ